MKISKELRINSSLVDKISINEIQKQELLKHFIDKDNSYVDQFLQNFSATFEFEKRRTTLEIAFTRSFNEAIANIEATKKLLELFEVDDLQNLSVRNRRAKYYREF